MVFFIFNLLFLLKLFVFDRYVARHPALLKKKLLNRTINRLNEVKDHGEISPILEGYLKEKASLGLSEINSYSIEALLSKHHVTDNDIKMFIRIKSASELSRFAPQETAETAGTAGAAGALAHDVNQLIEILKRIDGRIK